MDSEMIIAIVEDTLRASVVLSIVFFITCCGLSLIKFAGVI